MYCYLNLREVRVWKSELIKNLVQVISILEERENHNDKGHISPPMKTRKKNLCIPNSLIVLWKISGMRESLLNCKFRIKLIEMFGVVCSK